MVLTTDTSDTARLIALRLHWIAGVLLALELVTAACKTTPQVPNPIHPPAAVPGDDKNPEPGPTTTLRPEIIPNVPVLPNRTVCSWGRR